MLTNSDIAHLRLYHQRITQSSFERPEEVVKWLGAVQSQDYGGAKWAVAQRTKGLTEAALDQAFAEGSLLRTHVLRPTWHFVTPADIRWMLELTAPRINALVAHYYRKLELDEALFALSNAVLAKALQGGKQLTRLELAAELLQAGIATQDLLRLSYILGRAELDALICSGSLRGKQHTYALLAERAPQARTLKREDALAELARRYLISHGPATLKDYIWWSGLAAADARAGFEMVKFQFNQEVVDGQTYWFAEPTLLEKEPSPAVYLLPNYDEYVVGYTDRSAIFDPTHTQKLDARGNPLFNYIILLDSQLTGTWKRTSKKNTVVIEANHFVPLNSAQIGAFEAAAERYGQFLGLPVTYG